MPILEKIVPKKFRYWTVWFSLRNSLECDGEKSSLDRASAFAKNWNGHCYEVEIIFSIRLKFTLLVMNLQYKKTENEFFLWRLTRNTRLQELEQSWALHSPWVKIWQPTGKGTSYLTVGFKNTLAILIITSFWIIFLPNFLVLLYSLSCDCLFHTQLPWYLCPLFLSPDSFFPVLSTYVLIHRTAADITRESLVLLYLKPWQRESNFLLSWDRKSFGNDRNFLPLSTILTYFLDWQCIRKSQQSWGTLIHPHADPTHGSQRNWCGDEGLWLKRLFFGLNSPIPTSWWWLSSNPLTSPSEGVRVHEAQLLTAWHHHYFCTMAFYFRKSHLMVSPILVSLF